MPSAKDLEQIKRLRSKYPDRIPILIETLSQSSVTASRSFKLTKTKFLVPGDNQMSHFCSVVRGFAEGIHSSDGLFYFCTDPKTGSRNVVPMNLTMYEVQSRFCDHTTSDFPPLIIHVMCEATFGEIH